MTLAPVSPWEAAARLFEPPAVKPRRWASPLDMACELDPTVVRTRALDVINAALVDLAVGRNTGNKLAVFMSPQEGKSTLCSYWTPLWLLSQVDSDLRILSISYSAELARRWGADVKLALESHNGDEGTLDLGLRLRADSRAAGRWQIEGHRGGIYCAGVGGGITGKPADWIGLDDPLKNMEEAQSEAYRDRVMNTWRGVLIPRMAPHTKVVWIQTLWHEAEPIRQILDGNPGGWKVVRIPAIADSPDDPLGREIGEPMESARGHRDWARIQRETGESAFSALYQQRPSPAEGNLFKRVHWRYWSPAPYSHGYRFDLAGKVRDARDCWRFITGDLAASKKTSADWTVAAAWALTIDGDLVLLDRMRARVGEAHHFDLFRPLAERWQIDTIFLEKSQHATTLVTEAAQSGLHITPLTAEADKVTRAIPYSARVQGGRVWLPAGAPWVGSWVDEHAAFDAGSHDDQVDVGAYACRVAITKWAPPPPRPLPIARVADREIDLLNVPL